MARGRRTIGWVGTVLVLLVAAWGVYGLFEELADTGPDAEAGQLLLPALSLSLVVLVLALAGVLIRNLVRLIVDRKRGILGARLRTKLVFFFLALVLLPAVILFTGSSQVIKQSVEALLRTPLEDLGRQASQILDEWSEHFQGRALRRAGTIAERIAGEDALRPDRVRQLDSTLEIWQLQDEAQLITVHAAGRVVAESDGLASTADEALRPALDRLVAPLVDQARRQGRAVSSIDYLGDRLLAQAACPVPANGGAGVSNAVVSVAIMLPTRLTQPLEDVARAESSYRQFRIQRRELVRLYVTLIALIFVVTLFIATWVGLYLARRITEPIQELAAASREISAGNLSVRVGTDAGDEMGTLVDAFNEMAAELQENREVITRSTADLRRSNRALDERRRYIETLLANLSTAVISLDPRGRVTTANPAVTTLLDVRLVAGDEARDAFRRSGLHPLADLLEDSPEPTADGVRRDVELQRGNRSLNVSVQVSPLRGGSGELLGSLMMVEDLTELLRAQKAAAWREIARRIAHEIKNPLTPIQLAAQRLRKRFSEGSDLGDVLPEATDSIEHEVGALKRLVDEFSRFARMPEVVPRQVALREIVEPVLALYRGMTDVTWEVEVETPGRTVLLDPEQIRRVLINLIDNAISAMEGRGAMRLAASCDEAGGHLRIEVADNGPGILPQDRDKMFSPYFSTKRRGTGLGLAIVHKVVTDHQGTIRVEDNEPRGARFVIEIPALRVRERHETWS